MREFSLRHRLGHGLDPAIFRKRVDARRHTLDVVGEDKDATVRAVCACASACVGKQVISAER